MRKKINNKLKMTIKMKRILLDAELIKTPPLINRKLIFHSPRVPTLGCKIKLGIFNIQRPIF